MKKPILFVLFLSLSALGYSQTIEDSIKDIRNKQVFLKWVYFQLADTITGEIIVNDKAGTYCDSPYGATAALTIIKAGFDTIRVIDQCDTNSYSKGQKVNVVPREGGRVESSQIMLPISGGPGVLVKKRFLSKKYKNLKVIDSGYPLFNEYDKTILKTTWGQIIAQ